MKNKAVTPDLRKVIKITILFLLIVCVTNCSPLKNNGSKPASQEGEFIISPSITQPRIPTNISSATKTPDDHEITSKFSPVELIFSNFGGIYSINIENGEQRIIDENSGAVFSNINVNNGNLFFNRTMPSDIGFGPSKIFTVENNGNNIQQLTFGSAYESNLAVSNDGSYLVYSSDDEETTNRYKILLFNLKTLKEKTIASNNNSPYVYFKWSPDNQKLIYFEVNKTDNNGKLFLYNLENDTVQELLSDQEIPLSKLAWAPSGERIILGLVLESQFSISTYNIPQKSLKKIIFSSYPPQNFQWSPQSDYVLFEYLSKDASNSNNCYLNLLNLNNEEITVIQEGFIDGRWNSYQARWSKKGDNVEYIINSSNNLWEINIYNLQTKSNYRINSLSPFNGYPESWVLFEK